jgi:hypothetical protein
MNQLTSIIGSVASVSPSESPNFERISEMPWNGFKPLAEPLLFLLAKATVYPTV